MNTQFTKEKYIKRPINTRKHLLSVIKEMNIKIQ